MYSPNTWYFTPVCLFTKGTAINQQPDGSFRIPNRFLRPAYFRIMYGKQSKAVTLEVLSPAEFKAKWREPVLAGLIDVPVEVLRYAFPRYAIALSKFDNGLASASYIADRMFKDRDSKSDNHVDVFLNVTAASLPEGVNTMYHTGYESIAPLVLSSMMEVDTAHPILVKLQRSLERGEVNWTEVFNYIQTGEHNVGS
jgi:hypothetical protein